MTNKIIVSNVENEIRFIGSLVLANDLYLEYEKIIKPKYYFSDEVCLNVYDWFSVLYINNQKFNEKNLVIYLNQSEDKLSFFKKIGGWSTIEQFSEISDITEFKSYFQILQKYSLLRELESKGVNTERIRNHKNFDKSTVDQIYKNVRNTIDKIHTQIVSDSEVLDISDATELVDVTDGEDLIFFSSKIVKVE